GRGTNPPGAIRESRRRVNAHRARRLGRRYMHFRTPTFSVLTKGYIIVSVAANNGASSFTADVRAAALSVEMGRSLRSVCQMGLSRCGMHNPVSNAWLSGGTMTKCSIV